MQAALEMTTKAFIHPLYFESVELLELVSLRKPQLSTRCKKLGLSINGRKEDLLKRLLVHIGKPIVKQIPAKSDVLSGNRELKSCSKSTSILRVPSALMLSDFMHGNLLREIISFLTLPEKFKLSYVAKIFFESDIFSTCNFDIMPDKYHAIIFDHIIRSRTKLTELIIRVDLHEYDAVLGTIFSNCNIDHLQTLRVYLSARFYLPYYFTEFKFRQSNDSVVTRAKAAIERHDKSLNHLSYLCTESTTASLKHMRLTLPLTGDFADLLSFQSLITLQITICSISSDKFLEFLNIIENLRIQKFQLIAAYRASDDKYHSVAAVGYEHVLSPGKNIPYIIKSNSLEELDLSLVGKYLYFAEIDCPALKKFTRASSELFAVYSRTFLTRHLRKNYRVSTVPFSQSNEKTLANQFSSEHSYEYYGVVGDPENGSSYCEFYPIIFPPNCCIVER